MSVCIIGFTVITDYQEVKAVDIPTAFWGTLEASRAFWTALNAGGGVRGGGVSMSAFEHSSREDLHELQVQVMLAYTAFCIWKEKGKLELDHPDWSEEEVSQQAEVNGRLASDRFQNSAINVTDTTKNLTIKDFGYWKEFCNTFNSIAKNGLGIGSSGIVKGKVISNSGNIILNNNETTGENTFLYNDKYYVQKSNYRWWNGSSWEIKEYQPLNIPTDRVRIPYIAFKLYNNNTVDYLKLFIDVNRLTGEIITRGSFDTLQGVSGVSSIGLEQVIINMVSRSGSVFPIIIDDTISSDGDYIESIANNYSENLSVENSNSNVQEYEQDIKNALDFTEAGKAIREGAKDGQEEIIKSGAIPVKRSSVRTGEETATGEVGWDVPNTRTLEGAIAVPGTQDDVVEGMGIITVPEDVVTPKDDDTVAEWAKDEPISIPDTKDEPISKPIDDVISDQYGDYYPTQISLGDFFPFCIPFDIYYCVQKFNVGQGEAPIIHIPIVYPRALQGALGESYDVIIDFNNYIALRNIIRAFILIFFLIGLMQVTRNLIRG